MKGPLSGYRIIDLSRALAGPYGTMLLAFLGAEVIKIEPPGGEGGRRYPAADHKGESFFFLAFNINKKGITLDLGTESGKEAFYDLVKVSDVVLDNFRPGVMERLGADYETLKKINPRIISCSVSGYGSTGPYSDRGSLDIVALASSGILSMTGEPGGRPIRPGVPMADLTAAMLNAFAVASALAYRERTGDGQEIDISLLDACVSLCAYELSYYFCSGDIPGPLGSGHLVLVPFGIYKCKEGYLALGPAWPRMTTVIGAEWMTDDPRFKDAEARIKHREEFNHALEEHLAKATASEWSDLFTLEDIPSAAVKNLAEVAADPQVSARNMILTLPHPLGGEIKLVGNPVKMSTIDESEYTAPPTEGQHNIEVLSGILGYSEEKIKKLRKEEEGHREELALHLAKGRVDAAAALLQQRQAESEKKGEPDE